MRSLPAKKIILSAIAAVALILLLIALYNAGTYLVRKDAQLKGDAVIILMGSIADRVLEASDLFNAKMAKQMLIVEEDMGPINLLRSRGAHLISNTTQCKNVAVELGVPDSCISIIPGGANSTKMEAKLISQYLKQEKSIDTVLIVSSPAHTRRAGLIFEHYFRKNGLDVVVITCPSKYAGYTGKAWYTKREEVQDVLFEYIKLASFLVIEQFKLP